MHDVGLVRALALSTELLVILLQTNAAGLIVVGCAALMEDNAGCMTEDSVHTQLTAYCLLI